MIRWLVDTVDDFVEGIELVGYVDSWSMWHKDPSEHLNALIEGTEPPPANQILWDHTANAIPLLELMSNDLYGGAYGWGVLVMVSRGAQALRHMRSAS